MHERGADSREELEQVKRECLDRKRWRIYCH